MLLKGKVSVVTGGSSGIGFAIAERFAREGSRVFVVGRRQSELDKATQAIGNNAQAIQGDITVKEDLDRIFDTVQREGGKLDILVANSGMADALSIEKITEDHFDKTFDLNARGTLFTVQKAIPLMTGGGSIVLIGSIADSIGTPGYTAYNASKAAVRSFSRTWTNELASRNIRVNTLSPGPIDTPMMQVASEEVRNFLIGKIPLARLGKPEEVAAAALFLASDESRFIAGAELCIDGGMTQV